MIRLDEIKDPKLRARILRTLNDADQLKHELKASAKKDRGNRICKNCGKEFVVHTSAPDAHFCCQKCAASMTGRKTMAKNRRVVPRTKFVESKCPTCGNLFGYWKSSNRKYCSYQCSADQVHSHSVETMRSNGHYDSQNNYTRGRRTWVNVGGKRFCARSAWEANYSLFLQFQKEHGMIKDWDYEPDTFWFEGIRRGCTSYLPDFRIINVDDSKEYHELKGWMDSKSKTKIKRMAKYHPEIKLVVVDKDRYRQLASKVSFLFPGWIKRPRSNSRSPRRSAGRKRRGQRSS